MSWLERWGWRGAASKQIPVEEVRALGVRIGEGCRVYAGVDFGSEPYLVTIGDRVTLALGVQFATHDGGVWVFRKEFPDIDVFAPVRVGSNVFIGANAILLPGAEIGDDCVIGAGAVVTGRIPPRSVAAGVPARVIRSLDDYRAKVLERAMHIRGKSKDEKRRILCEAFGLPPGGGGA
jgi:acetyltransferase-like isoleucine patch superfamily enzyme